MLLDEQQHDIGDDDFSVTELIDPPKIVALKRIHKDEIVIDVRKRFRALLGSAIHEILRKGACPGDIAEERLKIPCAGHMISGGIDLQSPKPDGTWRIADWKTVLAMAHKFNPDGKESWHEQLNLYAHLAEYAGRKVSELVVHPLIADWTEVQTKRDGEFPANPIMEIQIPMWGQQERLDFLVSRVTLHSGTLDVFHEEDLPPCTEKEQWARPEEHKVKSYTQAGSLRKRADRNLPTREAAEAWAVQKGLSRYEIEFHPGKKVRCEDWCEVSQWCSQHRGGE